MKSAGGCAIFGPLVWVVWTEDLGTSAHQALEKEGKGTRLQNKKHIRPSLLFRQIKTFERNEAPLRRGLKYPIYPIIFLNISLILCMFSPFIPEPDKITSLIPYFVQNQPSFIRFFLEITHIRNTLKVSQEHTVFVHFSPTRFFYKNTEIEESLAMFLILIF